MKVVEAKPTDTGMYFPGLKKYPYQLMDWVKKSELKNYLSTFRKYHESNRAVVVHGYGKDEDGKDYTIFTDGKERI